MYKLKIKYWYRDLSNITGINDEACFDYSKGKRNKLIDLFLHYGCEIMIRKFDECMYLFIDNAGGRFRQR